MKFRKKSKQNHIIETITKLKKEQQNYGHGIKRGLIFPILIILMLGDIATIFPLMDSLFYQSQILSLAITIIAGFVLEGVPYAAAHFLLKKKKEKKEVIFLAALGIAFLLVFTLLFNFRMNSQDIQYQATGTELNLSGEVADETEQVFIPTKGQSSMTLLLSILPLCTSVLAFVISCAYNPEELKKEHDELAMIQMKELLANMQASENEIKQEQERDLTAYDETLYQSRLADLDKFAKMEKLEVRRKMAMKLGTADAVSKLLEGGTKI